MVRLGPAEGSEQGGTRPVLVVSNDVLNEALPVLTVAAVTSRKADRVYPTEVLMQPPDQLRTVSKDRVGSKLGAASAGAMALIEEALRLALDLS
jgi:mRNA interferase MazF